jgi:hypothetical protein
LAASRMIAIITTELITRIEIKDLRTRFQSLAVVMICAPELYLFNEPVHFSGRILSSPLWIESEDLIR